jgi:hypothetical protein
MQESLYARSRSFRLIAVAGSPAKCSITQGRVTGFRRRSTAGSGRNVLVAHLVAVRCPPLVHLHVEVVTRDPLEAL